ncbi:MAG: hypothetical protein MZV70_14020 [Desulfobacterales bacterium]|nr:hypothetical protein [Desulfobacterales bacterium]
MLLDLILHDNKEIEEKYPSIIHQDNKLIAEKEFPMLYGGKGCLSLVYCIARSMMQTAMSLGAIQVIRDVTENKRAEQSLKESEEQYRSLFESSQDAMFLLENTRFKNATVRQLHCSGCTKKKEIVGRSLIDFSPIMQPDHAAIRSKKHRRKFQQHLAIPAGFRLVVYPSWTGAPLYTEVTLNRVTIGGKTLAPGNSAGCKRTQTGRRCITEKRANLPECCRGPDRIDLTFPS